MRKYTDSFIHGRTVTYEGGLLYLIDTPEMYRDRYTARAVESLDDFYKGSEERYLIEWIIKGSALIDKWAFSCILDEDEACDWDDYAVSKIMPRSEFARNEFREDFGSLRSEGTLFRLLEKPYRYCENYEATAICEADGFKCLIRWPIHNSYLSDHEAYEQLVEDDTEYEAFHWSTHKIFELEVYDPEQGQIVEIDPPF